jgi:hypothetical protein
MSNFNILQSLSNNSFIPFPDRTFHNFDGKFLRDCLDSKKPLPKVWDFQGSDKKILFDENLKTQSEDWYYRNNKIKYTLNSQGYRTQEFDTIDWENSIVIFGCSIILGAGVTDEHTIPYFLEQILNVPVINMGVGGSSIQVAFHNSMIMQRKYPPPKAVLYSWTSLTRNAIYTKDQGIINSGTWRNKSIEINYTDLIIHNLLNILYIRNLWKNKTKMVEYSTFSKTKNIIETTFGKDPIIHGLLDDEIDLARDLSHNGPKTNLMIAEKIANYFHE